MQSHSFRHSPDFQANPARAVTRRALWRLHWAVYPHRPLVMRKWWRDLDIALPRSASAATVYYAGCSYGPMIQAMAQNLRPGDVFLDVGAHAGEYALIAARMAGPLGVAHAIEPQPQLAAVIRNNAERNRLSNLRVHACAICDVTGSINFFFDPGSMGGWPATAAAATVPSFTLDDFVANMCGGSRVDLIKLDAGGNELAALRGAERLLTSSRPAIIAKLYHPDVVRQRHGSELAASIDLLHKHGYSLELLDPPDSRGPMLFESLDQIGDCYNRTDIYNYDFCIFATARSAPEALSITQRGRNELGYQDRLR